MITAKEALDRLQEGNRRFIANQMQQSVVSVNDLKRQALVEGQQPFAIILGCSDSRVPPELIFDQGLGALFVIRVAGNIVLSSQIESIEFAVENLGTPLAVVLGHTHCGAVQATIDQIKEGASVDSAIAGQIRPTLESLLPDDPTFDSEALLRKGVRANIRVSADNLRKGSSLLSQSVKSGKLTVACAEYDLESGVVEFFE